jgi:hypothetical protein
VGNNTPITAATNVQLLKMHGDPGDTCGIREVWVAPRAGFLTCRAFDWRDAARRAEHAAREMALRTSAGTSYRYRYRHCVEDQRRANSNSRKMNDEIRPTCAILRAPQGPQACKALQLGDFIVTWYRVSVHTGSRESGGRRREGARLQAHTGYR